MFQCCQKHMGLTIQVEPPLKDEVKKQGNEHGISPRHGGHGGGDGVERFASIRPMSPSVICPWLVLQESTAGPLARYFSLVSVPLP